MRVRKLNNQKFSVVDPRAGTVCIGTEQHCYAYIGSKIGGLALVTASDGSRRLIDTVITPAVEE